MGERWPHVRGATALRWVIGLHEQGVQDVSDMFLDVQTSIDQMHGQVYEVEVLLRNGHSVLRGECLADGSVPATVRFYAPGSWTAELYRQAILAYDNEEE
jgi:hypothetical protein